MQTTEELCTSRKLSSSSIYTPAEINSNYPKKNPYGFNKEKKDARKKTEDRMRKAGKKRNSNKSIFPTPKVF